MKPAAALVVAIACLARPAGAVERCEVSCGDDLSCVTDNARCHLAAGQPRRAIELLRARRREAPADTLLVLARAYLDDHNRFWALRVLREHLADHPEACVVRSWIAWLAAEGGDLAGAREVLTDAACPGESEPMRARWHLIEASVEDGAAASGGAPRTLAMAARMRRPGTLFEDDAQVVEAAVERATPGRMPPLAFRAEATAGWTSNGRLSSPTDPGGAGLDGRSPVTTVDLAVRGVAPSPRALRPVLDASLRAAFLSSDTVRELSYVSPTLRPALLLGGAERRWLIGYSASWLVLEGGDAYSAGPRLFLGSHRGETELELGPRATLFAGAGRTLFREQARTRTEVDVGGGITLPIGSASLLAVASARLHRAEVAAFDVRGASLLAALQAPVGRSLALRATGTFAFDDYPRSAGYFQADEARRDLLLRGSVTMYARTGRGIMLGLGYDPSWRLSSAETYAYVDHRVLVRVRWGTNADPSAGPRIPAPGGVRLWGGPGGEAALAPERIQDLLRQEDAARRSSSCVGR